VEVSGSLCANNGKAAVTVNVKANEGAGLDLSNTSYVISSGGIPVASIPKGQNYVELAPGTYTMYSSGMKCNGALVQPNPQKEFTVKFELKVEKAEYKRCSASDISVSTKVVGGTGPYTYQLLGGGSVVKEISDGNSEFSFSATTASSDLKIKVIDNGCTKNNPAVADLTKTSDLSTVTSVIEGDKTVCKNGTVELSVKNTYQGSNFKWKKGNAVISTTNTLKIENATETDAGEYSFSMIFDGCSNEFSETFNIGVGNPPVPNVATPAYICLNSNPVSLSNYASVTSGSYILVWYKADSSPIGETAPSFNPNMTGTTKYLVSQKNSTGCESAKAELTVIVENLPSNIGANNVRFCMSNDLKPKMRIINAGNYTYNLYTAYSGGTKIGSGTSVNDTAIIETTQDLVTGANYFLETVNTHGCAAQDRMTVNVALKESLILGSDKICFGDNLSLSADYSGGKIVWTMPDNSTREGKTLSINDMKFENAGIYNLLIEESGLGCIMKDEIHVKVTQPATPIVATDSFRYFQNETASAMTATPKEGLTLKWYNPQGVLIAGQSPVPATDVTGVFVYHVSQDSLGCESPKVPVTVIVGNIPSAVPASDINVCIADKPSIQIKNTTQDYKYTVYHKNSVIAEGTGNGGTISLTSGVSITEDTEIEITVSDIYGVKSPVVKKGVISVNSLITAPSALCTGSDAQLVALLIDQAAYKWTLPNGTEYNTRTISVTGAKSEDSGIYTLALTTSGCPVVEVTKYVNVTHPAPPVVDKDSYRFYENENASPLTATPKEGLTLKWYDPEGALISGQSPKPATNQTGTFVYHVSQDSLGCESPKVPVTVVVGNVPSAVPAADINVCIADKPVIQIKNTVQDYKYTVYYKNSVIAEGKGNGGTISLTSSVSITENAEFEITVSDTYNVSSARTAKSVVSVNSLIDLQNSSTAVCDGSNGKLVAVAITDAVYVWTTPTGTITAQSVTITGATGADAGIYTLSVTTSGCPAAQQSVELKVEKPAKPATTQEIRYCLGAAAAKLTAMPLSGYKLVWFDESHTQLSDAPVPATSAAGTSVYYVSQVSVSDANCTSDMEKITVFVENRPDSIVLAPVNICVGNAKPMTVRIPAGSEGYTYGLYTAENGGSLAGQAVGATDDSPVDIAIDDKDIHSGSIYYLQVTNKSGCVSGRTPVEIILTEITLSPDELPSYQLEEFYSQTLKTNAADPVFSIVQGYLPLGFTLSVAGDISGTAASYSEPSIFTVEVSDNSGCSIKKEYTLKSELLVSKMFSPNGDGINDVFMSGYKLIIFDRLGRKLFAGDNGWDGSFSGKIMPEDVYYYILYHKNQDGKEQHVTGYVTLIKTI
jgi:gliding motility-associated-like protein